MAWFGSRSCLQHIDRSFQVEISTIQPSSVVRDLDVYQDTDLTMKQHVAKIAAACFYHIYRLRQVRRLVGQEITQQLFQALIASRLDYCNRVFAGRPKATLEPLQRLQNAAARLVFNLGRFDHVRPSLIQLRWLRVNCRIKFNLCCFAHVIYYGRSLT